MKFIRKTSYDIKSDYTMNLLRDRKILPEQGDTDWYFKPTIDNFNDPMLLDHLVDGYQLYKKHLENGSRIRVYVDCDVDGFTSAAVFVNYYNDFLKEKYPNV